MWIILSDIFRKNFLVFIFGCLKYVLRKTSHFELRVYLHAFRVFVMKCMKISKWVHMHIKWSYLVI